MKHLFAILGLFATLSVGAQTTVVLSNPNVCSGQSVTAIANATGYGNDTLNFTWLENGVGFGMPSNDTITYTPATGSWNLTVLVTTPGGQSLSPGFATITVNANPTATATNTGPYCVGGTIQLNAGGGTSYAWTGPNGFSSNAQNPSNPAQTANAGTYTVTVTANGCSDTATTNVVVNPLPTPNITVSPNDTVCQGTIIALSATGGVSYVWSSGNNILIPGNIGNNLFSVTATDANGCQGTSTTNVVVNANPITWATALDVTCFGANDGNVIGVVVNGVNPISYLWNTGQTSQSLINVAPGIYTLTSTDANGCSGTASDTVIQPAILIATISGQTNVDCNGGNDGTATVAATGGTAPYSYSWSDGGVGNQRNNLAAGIHTVTVSDANGCSDTANVTITEPSILTANANGGGISCFGGNNGTAVVAVAGGTPGYTYSWTGGGSNDTISSLTAGTYIVTVTDANGCSDTSGVTINQPSQVSFTYTQVNVLCNGNNTGSITVTGNGGVGNYQFELNGNNNWTSNNTFSNLIAGTYTIMARDANMCTAGPTTAIITEPNVLQATIGTIAQACDSSGQAWVQVSGGQGPYSFQWSNSLGTNDSIQAVAGTYNVTVIDANSCQAFGTAAIATPTPVSITGVPSNPTCFGLTDGSINTTVVTGELPITYAWSNLASTADISNLSAPGTYTLIATASNGCQDIVSWSLVNPAPLNVSSNDDTTSCFGTASGTLTALATGGTGNYSFAWSPSGGNAGVANGLGAGIYTVTVTDANGCTASDQGQVFNAPALQANSVVTNVQCAGSNTGSIDLTVTGGTGLIQYSWTGPNGFNQISPDIWNLATGNYTVTATDVNSCTITYTTTVGGSNLPTMYVNLTATNICGNGNTGSITAAISGGTAPYNYLWSNNATSPSIGGLTPGSYEVTITDANGCQAQGSVDIQGSPAMTINLVNQVLCEGNSELLDAGLTGGTWPYQFVWETPYGNIFTTNNVNPSQEGTYQLTITDGFGCVVTGTMFVDLIPCNTGIDDLNAESIKLFPNPTTSGQQVTITLPSNINEVTIDVTNSIGQSVFHATTNGGNYSLDTFGWGAGTYVVQISSHDQVVRKRLDVQ